MKSVLVIVVTYNGMPWLDRCLGSVSDGDVPKIGTSRAKKADFDGDVPENGTSPSLSAVWGPNDGPQTAVQAKLYVWDNASTDGSADFVAEHYPEAILIRSTENLGFSRPNNEGMKYALEHGYDYVYLLNQDAWLEEGALAKLVAVAQAHPEYGLLSPLQMTDGYKALDKQFAKCLGSEAILEHIPSSGTVSVPFVMAAHWLVPVSVIKRIGLFEEELFPLYGQDEDWCQRLDFCGLKIGVVKEARGVHDRAYRKEPVEKLVYRNFYTGSLVRLVNPAKSFSGGLCYCFALAVVKSIKYRSLLPFKYLRRIKQQMPQIKAHRARASVRT